MRRKILVSLICVMVLMTSAIAFGTEFTEVPSGDLSVEHDDGNGTLFKQLPVNYARLNKLDLGKAVILSGSGYTIQNAQSGDPDKSTNPHLVWKGKVQFGGERRTADKNSETVENKLPAVTLKFPGGATLSDGKSADVIVAFDQISYNLTKSYNSDITSDTDVYVLLAFSDSRGLWLNDTSPKTAIDKWDYTNENKSTSAGAATKVRVTIKVTEKASGKSVGDTISSDEYPCMLIEYKDIDVRDNTVKTSATFTEKYDGPYAEGVELLTGWGNPVVLAPNGDGILNQSLVEKKIVNGNTRIKGIGSQYEALGNVTGNPNDTASFYSGFAAPASPAGFSFIWTGSVAGGSGSCINMATNISGQPTVSVKAKRSQGGSLGNDEIGAKSGLDTFVNNTHLMNSAATYYYKPDTGWRVDYLKVEGEKIELTEEQRTNGGSYDFTRLNKSPVTERIIRNGNVLDSTDSGFYEIEVRYIREPAYSTDKNVFPDSIRTMSSEPVTYTIHCMEEYEEAVGGTYQIKDDLADGLIKIVPDSVKVTVSDNCTYTIDKNDDNGLWVTFNSCKASGSCPEITITYKATVNWEKYESGKIINHADGAQAVLDTFNDIRITKEVKGKLRDTTKQFEFSAEIEGLDPEKEYRITEEAGGKITAVEKGTREDDSFRPDNDGKAVIRFALAGDQSIYLGNMPVGTTYRISESASNHEPAFIQTSDQKKPKYEKETGSAGRNNSDLSTEWEILDKQDGQITVTFINSRDPEPVTGVVTSDWKLPAMAVITVAAAFTLFLLKIRRKDTEGGEK